MAASTKRDAALSAKTVVDRSRGVAALYVRSRIEGGMKYSSGDSKRRWTALARRLDGWTRENGGALSPKEKKLLGKALGTWTERATIDANWRLEALGVLLWAASLKRTIDRWDVATKSAIVAMLDTPSPAPVVDLASVLARAKLRSDEALERARDTAELWHWRANTAHAWSRRSPAIVKDAAEAALARGDIKRVVGGDFPWRKKPFAELNDDQLSEAHSIAVERHHALEWLTDERPSHASWDSISTDT